jgi:hypothetical protein
MTSAGNANARASTPAMAGLAADRIDVEIPLLDIQPEGRVRHGGIECLPQLLDPPGRHAQGSITAGPALRHH